MSAAFSLSHTPAFPPLPLAKPVTPAASRAECRAVKKNQSPIPRCSRVAGETAAPQPPQAPFPSARVLAAGLGASLCIQETVSQGILLSLLLMGS